MPKVYSPTKLKKYAKNNLKISFNELMIGAIFKAFNK